MALKEYEVTVDGRHPHKTTMLLNEVDAKRLGATEVKAAAKTESKSRTPANKAAKAPANKAKAPAANKKTETPVKSAVEDASDPDASE